MDKVNQNNLSKYSPAYWQMRPKWTTSLDLYEPVYGGGVGSTTVGVLAQYLTRHPAEDDAEFARRAFRVAQVNVIKMVIDFYLAMLYSTSIRITSEQYQDEVDSFVNCCNLQGDSLREFFREQVTPQALLYGLGDIFVDLPEANTDIVSKAQEIENGLNQPYCNFVPPLNRVRWQVDAAGAYSYYQSLDIIDTQINPQFDIKHQEQYQAWQPNQVTVFAKDGTVIKQVPNPFGFIPAVTVAPIPSVRFYEDKMGDSLIDGLVEIQREILNTMSEISDYHTNINFSLMTITQDIEAMDAAPDEGEVKEVGNNRIMGLKGKDSKAQFVQPDPSGVLAMQQYVEWLISKAFKLAYIALDSNEIKTHTSAQTIRSNQSMLYNRLTRISEQLAKGMRQTIEMALRVQNIDPKAAKVKVEWDDNFPYDSFINRIEELQALKDVAADISPTAVTELAKQVFTNRFYDSQRLQKMESEADKWKPPVTPEANLVEPNRPSDPLKSTNTDIEAATRVK